MKVIIGADHGGFNLKELIVAHVSASGHEVKDVGVYSLDRADYPNIAKIVSLAVSSGEYDRGILVCSTGIGMSIAANKFRGIRAAEVTELYGAKYTRLHNDANILCMGEMITGRGVALEICDVFLSTEHEGGRHTNRVGMISEFEKENSR